MGNRWLAPAALAATVVLGTGVLVNRFLVSAALARTRPAAHAGMAPGRRIRL
jgi:hypothetical protein